MQGLYSTFIVEPSKPWNYLELFTYSASQRIPISDEIVKPYHTNVPRSGNSGLPMGWHLQIVSWRARTSMNFLTDPLLEWASQTSIELHIGGQLKAKTPLADLLMASQILHDGGQNNPPRAWVSPALRENVNYMVTVSTDSVALERFGRYLIDNATHDQPKLMVVVWLEGPLTRER